jgi:hypothetical protein
MSDQAALSDEASFLDTRQEMHELVCYTCDMNNLQVRLPCYLMNNVAREVTNRQPHDMRNLNATPGNVEMGRSQHLNSKLL